MSGYIHKYYSICDEVDNQSDHVPIVITFQIELEHSLLTSNLHKVRTSWKKANSDDISEYKSNLDDCLSRIMLPYDCLHIALMFYALILNTLRVFNYYMIT